VDNLWILYALTAALTLATSDALTKKALSGRSEYAIAWLRLVATVPVLVPVLMVSPVPQIKPAFYTAVGLSIPLEIVAVLFYVKALKLSPLSLTLPFLSLTPVFLLVIPVLVLGESITPVAAVGVILVAAGGYCLNAGERGSGWFGPVKAIVRERGSMYMIAVALIYSVTSTLGKQAVESSSPLFFGAVYYLALTGVFAPIAFVKSGGEIRDCLAGRVPIAILFAGLLYGVMVCAHMIGISLTQVACLISVKRLSLIIGVCYGCWFFHEGGMRTRLLGTCLMVSGVVLIVLFKT